MGESYLKRKLFRLNKSSTYSAAGCSFSSSKQNSLGDSQEIVQEANSSSSSSGRGGSASKDQRESREGGRMRSSQSMPQMRPPRMMTAVELIRSSTVESQEEEEEEEIREASELELGEDLAEAESVARDTSKTDRDHRRRRQRNSTGKLRSTSKALLFFRRAASALKNSASSNGLSSSSPLHEIQHLTGLAFQRQNTTDSSSRSNRNLSSLSLSQSADNKLRAREEQQAFLVPRMNSLKMPLVCLVKSLEGELMREVFVHRYELGQYLFESLKVSTGLQDCKFFGLRLARSFAEQEDLRNPWLDLNESVCKQIKQLTAKGAILFNATSSKQAQGVNQISRSIDFYLRIKFYPPNLTRVQDSFLRHYLWLQLRRDLSLGKLISSMNNLTLMMACVLQYELGDFKAELVDKIQSLNILPNQDLIEGPAVEFWSSRLVGCRKHQAQMKFLRAAVILETYGFDYYPVRDHQRQRAYLLGFNYAGIKTIRNGRIVHHLRWHSLSKICYERRMIIFHQQAGENSKSLKNWTIKRKQILGFKCLSNEDCQNLYMRLLEQKYFFTVDLAYFDKSIRRPSCLYASQSINGPSTGPEETAAKPEQRHSSEFISGAGSQWLEENNAPEPPARQMAPSSSRSSGGVCPQESPIFTRRLQKATGNAEEPEEEESLPIKGQPQEENPDGPCRSWPAPDCGMASCGWSRMLAAQTETWRPEQPQVRSQGHTGRLLEGLASLLESVLLPLGPASSAGRGNHCEAQDEQASKLTLASQVLKFCLLVLLMNLLFHLCDDLATFLAGMLKLSPARPVQNVELDERP